MPGPSPYDALYALFGHPPLNETEHFPQHITVIRKPKSVHSKIDNACQTQPLRDYSYNKVVKRSKRKVSEACYEDDNFKILKNNYTTVSSNEKSSISSRTIGIHLKNSHVNAVYKTVSDIKHYIRRAQHIESHGEKCLCSNCGTLGVITDSLKHPVDFDDSSSSDDDDYNDDDDEEDQVSNPRIFFPSNSIYKNKFDDCDKFNYDMPNAENYVRLIMELDRMKRRVRSLERLALRHNIPITRNNNRTDRVYDRFTQYSKVIFEKPVAYSSSSNCEINAKHCGLFSIPQVIRRRFTKKQDTKQTCQCSSTINKPITKPATLRSRLYKCKQNEIPVPNDMQSFDFNKKYQSNNLDEKVQNFDLSLLNENEMCELMFHLNKKNHPNTTAKQKNHKTIVPPKIPKNDTVFLYQKPEMPKLKSDQSLKPERKSLPMRHLSVGSKNTSTFTEKSIRNDKIFLRRSPNYNENIVDPINTSALLNDFLKINNLMPHMPCDQKDISQHQKILNSFTNEESINESKDIKTQNDIITKVNLDKPKIHDDASKFETQTSNLFTNASFTCKSSKSSKFGSCPEKEWVSEYVTKSFGVIDVKSNVGMKIIESTTKDKIGKTVTYSKENEYCFFGDDLDYINLGDIGEQASICEQTNLVRHEDNSNELPKDFDKYKPFCKIPTAVRIRNESSSPEVENTTKLPKVKKATNIRPLLDYHQIHHVQVIENGNLTKINNPERNSQIQNRNERNSSGIKINVNNANNTLQSPNVTTIKKSDTMFDEKLASFINKTTYKIADKQPKQNKIRNNMPKQPESEDIHKLLERMNKLNSKTKPHNGDNKFNKEENKKRKENENIADNEIPGVSNIRNEANKKIVQEIHKCNDQFPFQSSYSFTNPYFVGNKTVQPKIENKSILKTYKRVSNDSVVKLNQKNSVVINKFKKRVNLNIAKKVSSSVIYDIFKRKGTHNIILTKIFRKKARENKKPCNHEFSKIPKLIKPTKSNNYFVSYPNSHSSEFVSKIPMYVYKKPKTSNTINKQQIKSKTKFVSKIPRMVKQLKKPIKNYDKEIFFYYETVKKEPLLKKSMENKIYNIHKHDAIITNSVTECTVPNFVFRRNNRISKIPLSKTKVKQIPNKKSQATVPRTMPIQNKEPEPIVPKKIQHENEEIQNKSSEKREIQNNDQRIISNNEQIQIEDQSTTCSDKKDLVVNDRRAEIHPESLNTNELIFPSLPYVAITSPQPPKVINTQKTSMHIIPIASNVLSSYKSQIDKVEREIMKSNNKLTSTSELSFPKLTDSLIITSENDLKEEKSIYTTAQNVMESYESSSSYSENCTDTIFASNAKVENGNDMSTGSSYFDSPVSNSLFSSRSNLSGPNPKVKSKMKWMKLFGRKIKSFLSVSAQKITTVESSLTDVCNDHEPNSIHTDDKLGLSKEKKHTLFNKLNSNEKIKSVKFSKANHLIEPVKESTIWKRKWYKRKKLDPSNFTLVVKEQKEK